MSPSPDAALSKGQVHSTLPILASLDLNESIEELYVLDPHGNLLKFGELA